MPFSSNEVLLLRQGERDEEFRRRMMELDLAFEGIPPVGATPRAPAYGARAFTNLLAKVDRGEIFDTAQQIHTRGYAILEGLLTPKQVDRAREDFAPFFSASADLFAQSRGVFADRQTQHIHNVLAKSSAADTLATLPRLRAVTAAVLGFDYVLNAGVVAMAPDPGCDAQGLHRDDGYYAVMPRPHPPLVLTVTVALDDFTADNGTTELVPESCQWPETRQPLDEEIIQCDVPAGAALLWDGAIFHGGGANRSEAARRSLTFNYTRGCLRTQFNQYLSVPRERVLEMPPELQADLGYRRSALGLGGCDLEDPLDYLKALAAAGGDGKQGELGRETGANLS